MQHSERESRVGSSTGMKRMLARAMAAFALLPGVLAHQAEAQGFTTADPVIKRLWMLGTDSSRVAELAQVLTDSIGPRLSGTSGLDGAQRWLVQKYSAWGIPVRNEKYGTWRGWRRGSASVELLEPRFRALDARLLAWSPGTSRATAGQVITLPDVADSAAFRAWVPQAAGKFVLLSTPEMTCRTDASLKQWSSPEGLERFIKERRAYMDAWGQRIKRTGLPERQVARAIEDAGAAGILTSLWSEGWNVVKIQDAVTERAPSLSVSCEDYGLLARLAERGQGPVVRVSAEAKLLGNVPLANTIAEIRGSQFPEEYVVLSAHLDSWDGASGATDNGTGTVMMMEAMRLLKAAYPRPKRTILAGHWSGEELRGLGSSAFAEDHPEITSGMQALFNQDNGTGRITRISMSGFLEAGAHFSDWLSRMPTEISRFVTLVNPGLPGGGSDHQFFLCHGAPAFALGADGWDYETYTWHTNLDTFDKISLEDLRANAVLVAMLAYEASEDPRRIARDRRILPAASSGRPRDWPECAPARRKVQ